MRTADEVKVWGKQRSQHELQTRVWVTEQVIEIGGTLRSV